jgi:hypothetical protein
MNSDSSTTLEEAMMASAAFLVILLLAPIALIGLFGGVLIAVSWNSGEYAPRISRLVRTIGICAFILLLTDYLWLKAFESYGLEVIRFLMEVFKKQELSWDPHKIYKSGRLVLLAGGLLASVISGVVIVAKGSVPLGVFSLRRIQAFETTWKFIDSVLEKLIGTPPGTYSTEKKDRNIIATLLKVLVLFGLGVLLIYLHSIYQPNLGAYLAGMIVLIFFVASTRPSKASFSLVDLDNMAHKRGVEHSTEVGVFKNGKRLRLKWRDINNHIHVLGQPGAGKSVFLRNIYAQKIATGSGLMMMDLKADIEVCGEIVALCKRFGRLEDLQIIDLSRPEISCGYNPLIRGNASELKDKLMSTIEWSEPYYKKMAERYLLNIMRALVELRDQSHLIPTLKDVHLALSTPKALITLASQLPDSGEAIRNELIELSEELKKKESRQALTGIKTDIEVMLRSEFGTILTSPNSLDLVETMKSGKLLYILLDGQTYGETAVRFGQILLAELRSASGHIVSNLVKNKRPRFTVIIDEFSDLVSSGEMARVFTGFLNRSRGSGIGVIIAHQSLGDFDDPNTAKQVIDCTETLFSFVQKDPDTCETLSGIAGTKEHWETTEQIEGSFLPQTATGRGTRKWVHGFLIHPNTFKTLGIGEAVYVAKKPTRFGLVRIHNLLPPSVCAVREVLAEINQQRLEVSERSSMLNLRHLIDDVAVVSDTDGVSTQLNVELRI